MPMTGGGAQMTRQPDLFSIATFDPAAAERLKIAGIGQAMANEGMLPLLEQVRRHLETLARGGAEFTSDDVYALAADCGSPLPDNVNMGSQFSTAQKRGVIRAVWCPSVRSKRANSHARTIKVWVGAAT
jgi:hypothetical protein